jgi:FkbM family methyltransferase
MMKSFYTIKLLREWLLPLFARFNLGNITIRHHFTQERFYLHSFKHKGYWFHGANREQMTMTQFAKLIKSGSTVIEVGGHIGYISLYYSQLVGEKGHVIVFEPGPNNLPYLMHNTSKKANIRIIEKAVSDTDGKLLFYVEELTGQNNTLIKNFERFKQNLANANIDATYKTINVEASKLDTILPQLVEKVDFIKIDVEGAELQVLMGAKQIIEVYKPIIMVESNDTGEQLFEYFSHRNYQIFSPTAHQIINGQEMQDGNFFCLHTDHHQDELVLITGNIQEEAS